MIYRFFLHAAEVASVQTGYASFQEVLLREDFPMGQEPDEEVDLW